MDNNEQIKQETIQTAIENLNKATGFKAVWKAGKIKELDGELHIQINGKPLHFLLEVKRELRNHQLPQILKQVELRKDVLVLAYKILPGIKEELRQKHIPYLEGNGNIFIDRKPVFIWVDNNKPLRLPHDKPNRAFTKAGLKVVFLFLMDPTYINMQYRTIVYATGTALGNVKNVINGLLEMGFVVKKNNNELMFNNKKALLDKWITTYEEKLKPVLHIGNFRFLKNEDWRELNVNPNETVWGGEPAGDILTNHLRPEIFTMYTTLNAQDLMKKFRVIPDHQGELKVYRKFWYLEDTKKTTPPILVYADLMNTNNKRCRETAQIIYERFIEPEL